MNTQEQCIQVFAIIKVMCDLKSFIEKLKKLYSCAAFILSSCNEKNDLIKSEMEFTFYDYLFRGVAKRKKSRGARKNFSKVEDVF